MNTSPPRGSPIDRPLLATVFDDRVATTKREWRLSLRELLPYIRDTTARTKDSLPWLKLAEFGDQRTEKKNGKLGSLRHNGNVVAIYGIEVDYDGEVITVDEAVDILRQNNVAAAIYTSPSNTPDRPRWRILCPTSEPLGPEERAPLVARLNGLFAGALSRESFTLSQAFYFGAVELSVQHHRVELVSGQRCIDECPELDAGAIWPKKARKPGLNGEANPDPPERHTFTPEQITKLKEIILAPLRNAPDGKRHRARVDVAKHLGGLLQSLKMTVAEAVEALLDAKPPSETGWDKERQAIVDGLAYGLAAPLSLTTEMQRYGLAPNLDFKGVKLEPTPHEAPSSQQASPDKPVGSEKTTIGAMVARLNAQYMVVNEAGRVVIHEPAYDAVTRRWRHNRITFDDFKRLYCNEVVQVGIKDGTPRMAPVAVVWLHHRNRRQYPGGVIFDPSCKHVRPDALNLWKGFAVEPRQGSWDLLRGHIHDTLCAGRSDVYIYVVNWLARLVQHPAEHGWTVLVFRGVEGSGKGLLPTFAIRMLGQHGLPISNPKHLTGAFNLHLQDCILLFADEAFHAGDKHHISVLKALVTEPSFTVEAKYANPITQPNYLHIIMASNDDWVVPASIESRRFAVMDVLADRVGDHDYFNAIIDQMETGGVEAMLYDLLHTDISDFNVRVIPQTDGLHNQRKLSLDTPNKWWVDCLHRGFVYASKLGLEEYFSAWHDWVATELLYASYMAFTVAHGERHRLSREAFGRFMITSGARPSRRDGVVGEHVAYMTRTLETRKPELLKKERAQGYKLGSLAAARDAFVAQTKLPMVWPPEQDGEP